MKVTQVFDSLDYIEVKEKTSKLGKVKLPEYNKARKFKVRKNQAKRKLGF